MGKHILEEANRCIQCKKPKCKEGCPVNTAIPEVIKMILDSDIKEAGKTLFNNNPLSVVCSLVCPHENQCEGHCILGIKGNPVQISAIENYVSDYYLSSVKLKKENHLCRKIAIVGSGPAGITIAFVLSLKGYEVTMFEAHDKIGGVLRYGIPDFRLPKDILDKLKVKLLELGVKIRPNALVGPVITIDNLFRDGYDAIFIGTGVWKPNTLNIKGESLGHVHYAIDYLKNPDVYALGDRVCVIGAGNVAMDVARTALRKGSKEVSILYRKGIENMPATKYEIEYAKIDGVKFEEYKNPLEIVDEGVKFERMCKTVDESGNIVVVPIEDSQDIFYADSVIVSVSQGPRANIVSNTKGIDTDMSGLVITDECGRTKREGVFASGDVVTGAKTVVEAVNISKNVAMAMDEYVTNKYNK